MDKSLKGTETEQNLLKAFAGESQARSRYTMFAKQARKDGYRQIEAIFMETAEQELQHAKRFFDFLEGGDVEITATYPAGKVGNTAENLEAAAMGENEEWEELYPKFAEVAVAEGFQKVANAFKNIAKVEKEHEARYRKLKANVDEGKVFEREEKVRWRCRVCGFVHEANKAPKACPACNHPQEHFEIEPDNY
ncbi:rubrerythrin [Marinilabilia sp.]|uniref:rubrerythrin n=1 Tax=Marinilabilia sp. TaxID=2021252 RepID=UPI0025BAE155|nr:rubrerythrin family protein [Marinilabilia sp.]